MKQFLILSCIVLLSACHPLAVNSLTTTPSQVSQPSSGIPTRISTTYFLPATGTSTPVPSNASTLLPPKSFDPATIQTFTPSSPAQCPKEDPSLELDIKGIYEASDSVNLNQQMTQKLLAFLNSGGSLQSILPAYERYSGGQVSPFFKVQDVTGDNIPELIFPFGIWMDIFGCKDGKYELLSIETYGSDLGGIDLLEIDDINRDGRAEIVVYFNGCMGNRCPTVRVYEWNGKDFQDLIANPFTSDGCNSLSVAPFDVDIRDIDNNGTKEIILSNTSYPQPDNDFPYRKETRICMWNGQNIVVYKTQFDAPDYRFQAVQDGDRETLSGDYDKAFGFYQQTINDKKLEWFTSDKKWHDFWVYHSQFFSAAKEPTPTVSPTMIQDPNEYPTLAAYASYRIMLLHILQDDTLKARSTLSALQSEFPTGNYFTQVAGVFWQEYQASMNMQNSCTKVVEYAQEHPLPTEYLGDWDHGVHSIIYTPESICPFR